MSIDARIDRVEQLGQNYLRLYLSPRQERDGRESLRGQSELTVVNFTRVPRKGQQIWGGSGEVIIEPGQGNEEQWRYARLGYTTLKEL